MTPASMPVVETGGTPFAIGYALGRHARGAIHREVRSLPAFRRLRPWLGHPYTGELAAAAREVVPDYLAEIEGLAAGGEWSFEEAFLWNAKGDLRAAGEPPGHGCTTLFAAEGGARWIVHNEDGAPAHRGSAFMVRARPERGLAFSSFAYPGLICGNSFAVNARGLVQTLDNVRGLDGRRGVPRQLVARAILDCPTLDAALALLRTWPRASGYHHGLAQVGDDRLLAVEAPASGVAVTQVACRHAHANHLVAAEFAELEQIVTDSSARRQAAAERGFVVDRGDALSVLLEGAIRGRATGAEDSWTLATARFRIDADAVALEVVQDDPNTPVFTETVRP